MARQITTKEMYTDVNGNLIAQYYDPSIDDFVPFAEQSAVRILDKDGNPISSDNGLPVQLTGSIVEKQPVNNETVVAGATSLITFRPERTIKAYSVLLKADASHPHKFRLVEFFGDFLGGVGNWFDGIPRSQANDLEQKFPKQDVVGAAGTYRIEITNDDVVDHVYNVYFTEWGL